MESSHKVVRNTILGLRIFNGFMFLLYGCFFVLVLVAGYFSYQDLVTYYNAGTSMENTINALNHNYIGKSIPMDPNTTLLIFGIFAIVLLGFAILYFLGFITAHIRSRANWIFHLVLCILSMSGLLTSIPAIFLIIGLASKETQEYYFKNKR